MENIPRQKRKPRTSTMSAKLPPAENVNACGISANNGGIALAGRVSIRGGMKVQIQQPSYSQTTKLEVCKNALFVTDPVIDRADLVDLKGKRVSGTCRWILKNEKYQKWCNKASGLLWISGLPGQGKTMISIFLTEELERTNTRTSDVMFFFCEHQKDNRNNSLSVLRGLLYQVLTRNEILVDKFWPYLESAKSGREDYNHGKRRHHQALASEKTLWDIFLACIEDSRCRPMVFLLDGVDECVNTAFVRKFVSLFEDGPNDQMKTLFKIILVSRDIPYLHGQERVRLDPDHEDSVKSDIETFISTKIAELRKYVEIDTPACRKLENTLLSRSEGTFLWVGFVIEELSNKRTTSEVLQTLETIPKGLHAIYNRIILQIDESHRGITSKILRWVTVVLRPLNVEELGHAVGIQPTENIGLDQLTQDHVKHCGQLLVLKNGSLSLIHQSLRDYLLRPDIDPDTVLEQFRVKEESAHFEIAQVCLQSLFVGEKRVINWNDRFSNDQFTCQRQHNDYSMLDVFHDYASSAWHSHVKHAGSMGSKLLAPFELQLDKNNDSRYCLETGLPYVYLAFSFGMTRLNLFCAHGITSWVREKCTERKKGPLSTHTKRQRSQEYYEALHTASVFGQEEVVNLLLTLEAYPNPPKILSRLQTETMLGGAWMRSFLLGLGVDVKLGRLDSFHISNRSRPILIAATYFGHTRVVETLLRAGAKTSITDSSGRTALHWASYHGYAQIVQILIDSGADIDATDEEGQTALHHALLDPQEQQIVSILLKNNANVLKFRLPSECVLRKIAYPTWYSPVFMVGTNTTDEDLNIAKMLLDHFPNKIGIRKELQICLRKAISFWNFRMAQLLVENGATFDFRDYPGIPNPLHAAVQLQDYDLIKECLRRCVAIDGKLMGITPLYFATWIGDEVMVQLLLDFHAYPNGYNKIKTIECKKIGMRGFTLRTEVENNHSGATALHAAILRNHESIARLLVEGGAIVHATCEHGHYPLCFAQANKNATLIRWLRECGANSLHFEHKPCDLERRWGCICFW